MPLRQRIGIVASLLKMPGLVSASLDFATFCRRLKPLAIQIICPWHGIASAYHRIDVGLDYTPGLFLGLSKFS